MKLRKKPNRLMIAIDFDGVIFDKGQPVSQAIDSIRWLDDQGYEITIFTSRAISESGYEFVEEWLDEHDIPYVQITATKINADYYIDDKAIHFITWHDALTQLELRNPLSMVE